MVSRATRAPARPMSPLTMAVSSATSLLRSGGVGGGPLGRPVLGVRRAALAAPADPVLVRRLLAVGRGGRVRAEPGCACFAPSAGLRAALLGRAHYTLRST